MIKRQLYRLSDLFGIHTQEQLAGLLGVGSSRVSEARKKGELPRAWLLSLYMEYSLSPWWVLNGRAPVHLDSTNFPSFSLHSEGASPVDRLRALFNVSRDKDLAARLKVHPKTVQYWRGRGLPAATAQVDLLMNWYINPQWLLFGENQPVLVHINGLKLFA